MKQMLKFFHMVSVPVIPVVNHQYLLNDLKTQYPSVFPVQ